MGACGCIAKVNGLLAPKNAQLLVNLLDDTYTMVAVCKLDETKRAKLPLVIASFCPFCGIKSPSRPTQIEGEREE